jgi:hypothetical protein
MKNELVFPQFDERHLLLFPRPADSSGSVQKAA